VQCEIAALLGVLFMRAQRECPAVLGAGRIIINRILAIIIDRVDPLSL
jgi:hypothetical protein